MKFKIWDKKYSCEIDPSSFAITGDGEYLKWRQEGEDYDGHPIVSWESVGIDDYDIEFIEE